MANIYELKDEYLILSAQLDMCETNEDADEILRLMEANTEGIMEKLDGYARFMRNIQSEIESRENEIIPCIKFTSLQI